MAQVGPMPLRGPVCPSAGHGCAPLPGVVCRPRGSHGPRQRAPRAMGAMYHGSWGAPRCIAQMGSVVCDGSSKEKRSPAPLKLSTSHEPRPEPATGYPRRHAPRHTPRALHGFPAPPRHTAHTDPATRTVPSVGHTPARVIFRPPRAPWALLGREAPPRSG